MECPNLGEALGQNIHKLRSLLPVSLHLLFRADGTHSSPEQSWQASDKVGAREPG